MARRKYQFESREAAEKAYRDADQRETVAHQALTAVLEGDVHVTLRKHNYTVKLARLDSPMGGIAIFAARFPGQRTFWASEYIDEFCRRLLDSERSYVLELDLRELAEDVRAWRHDYWESQKAQKAQTA